MTERKFHLGDILTITTGRLVSPRHVDGIYDILGFMTGDDLFTHQLLRAMDECREPLLGQHPDLRDIQVPDDFGGSEDRVAAWLAGQVAVYGETREVLPLGDGEHARIDPFTELQMIKPDTEIIVVEVPDA